MQARIVAISVSPRMLQSQRTNQKKYTCSADKTELSELPILFPKRDESEAAQSSQNPKRDPKHDVNLQVRRTRHH